MGLRGSDFVMLCSDTTAVQQIITIKQDEDKLIPIDSHKIMATAGEPGDRVQFSEYIIANVRLYAMRNDDTQLSTHAVAHYTRSEMATALRKVRSRPPRGCYVTPVAFCWPADGRKPSVLRLFCACLADASSWAEQQVCLQRAHGTR